MNIDRLKFEGMSFGFGQGVLLEEVTICLPMGEIVWLSGAGGSGKSSLLRLMAGLVQPSSGRYYLNSKNVLEMSFDEFLPIRLKIGFSMNEGGLLNNRTLKENIELPTMYHRKEDRKWSDYLMNQFGITSFMNERPALVRGALRKVTCLARALVLKPEVLLLDRPTDGIDKSSAEALARIIHAGKMEGWLRHVFIATDDLKWMNEFQFCTVKIKDKKVFCDDSKQDLSSVEEAS